ncbi:hypothetical protein TNCV_3387641 [Trichonephila clavipes]|nr:hypothetical protein TNCV_3387641 [Trichonephila clavipes]
MALGGSLPQINLGVQEKLDYSGLCPLDTTKVRFTMEAYLDNSGLNSLKGTATIVLVPWFGQVGGRLSLRLSSSSIIDQLAAVNHLLCTITQQ